MEETGLHFEGRELPLVMAHFLHPTADWPMPKIGFVFDGGRLTADQLAAIRLDSEEHDAWEVHSLTAWERTMRPPSYARLRAVEAARLGTGPAYLVSGGGAGAARP